MKNISLLLKQFYEYCRSKTPRCGKLGHFSVLQNDALMHREGLKGYQSCVSVPQPTTRSLKYTQFEFNPYSAGTDFSRQNLTSVDVRF